MCNHLQLNIMGRGRIRILFRDNSDGPPPSKDRSFRADSIPKASPQVFRELKSAVSKIESRIGIDLPQSNLGFSDDMDSLGVHFGSGAGRTVLLQTEYFNRNYKDIISDLNTEAKRKWLVANNSPLQYIMVHELGHSVWVDRVEGQVKELESLNRGIKNLYTSFKKEVQRGRVPISIYGTSNINEFFAETFAKGIIGKKQNRYSRQLIKLLKENRDLLKKYR